MVTQLFYGAAAVSINVAAWVASWVLFLKAVHNTAQQLADNKTPLPGMQIVWTMLLGASWWFDLMCLCAYCNGSINADTLVTASLLGTPEILLNMSDVQNFNMMVSVIALVVSCFMSLLLLTLQTNDVSKKMNEDIDQNVEPEDDNATALPNS